MATDNSPPRIRVILTTAFSTLVILVTLKYVFDSYFLMMASAAELDHLRPNEELALLRAGEEKNLTSGPMPIDRAMQILAQRGRAGEALIAPQPSDDLGPMVGWIRNPNQAVVEKIQAMQNAAANADAGAPTPEAAGDGGAATPAATTPDAGPKPPTATADGGAH
jgi:hypothetical protein